MRKITVHQISVFFLLFIIILVLGVSSAVSLLAYIPLGDYRGVVTFLLMIVSIYLYAFLLYRIFLYFIPLQEGVIEQGTRADLSAQVNVLFYTMIFNSLINTHFIPIPIMRLVYLALGARLGENTYSAGAILDPPLTEVGDNTIIGHNSALYCHAIEGQKFALSRIKIGNNVTVGAMAVIMPGVHIANGAIVSAGSVVIKNTQIGANEVWGGIPAKKIR